MPLTPGTRVGPYEILSAIGAGGMGEVYCARDEQLGRQVAIKVLPDSLSADPERLARFRREAQVLASLNHPNIAHIHGFQIAMIAAGGPTLAARLTEGPARAPTLGVLAAEPAEVTMSITQTSSEHATHAHGANMDAVRR